MADDVIARLRPRHGRLAPPQRGRYASLLLSRRRRGRRDDRGSDGRQPRTRGGNTRISAPCDLGISLQLANIARDVAEDDAEPCSFPGQWLDAAGIAPDAVLEPANRPALAEIVRRLCARCNVPTKHRPASAHDGSSASAGPCYRPRASMARSHARRSSGAKPRSSGGSVTTRGAKLGHVLTAFCQALLPARLAERPALSRRQLAAFGRAKCCKLCCAVNY